MVVAGLSAGSTAYAYPADQCAAARFGEDLNCTANDVSITGMRVVGDTTSCVGGTEITLDLEMTVNFATPNRWDIGIFISQDGKSPQTLAPAGASKCTVSVLPTASPFLNLDGGATGDTCGDGNGTIGGNTGSGIHYMPNVKVPCQSLGGAGGNLYIPFVVSWDNQSSPSGSLCTSNLHPVPNTKSKCNAPTVIQGTVGVKVLPSITKSDGATDKLFSGDPTTYTVTITNTTGASLGADAVIFKDPAVGGISVTSLNCSATAGASCPAGYSIAAMQGAGIALPAMAAGSSITFTIGATLTGTPGTARTNTATVSVGSESNSASDTNTVIDSITIDPVTRAQNGDKGATVTYAYTVYNYGPTADTVSLSVASSKGWSPTLTTPTSVTIPAGGSTTVTFTVKIPSGATSGAVDTTTLTARSGNYPTKSVAATAVTTVTAVLTLVPNNAASVGAGSSVWYSHRLQNNDSSRTGITLTPAFSCSGWSSALFLTDKTTSLTSPLPSGVAPGVNGGTLDFLLKVTAPAGAAANTSCEVTLTAAYESGSASSVSVKDTTVVKNLVLYEDAAYATESTVFPVGNSVYAKGLGVLSSQTYQYRWYDSNGVEACLPRQASTTGSTFPDTCTIPGTGPLGTWTVQIWNTTTNAQFALASFYVGPDHVKASYSGTNPPVNTDTTINLALHDKTHAVPFDPLGNLVKGSPTDTEGPLMITVSVSGSAEIVSSTLSNYVINGQTITGRLDSATGTATLTIRGGAQETVTVTPASYKGVLYGSTVRDEPTTVTFEGGVLGGFSVSAPSSASTCGRYPALANPSPPPAAFPSPPVVTVTAKDGAGATMTTYTGTVNLTTSTGRGLWAKTAAANGTLTPNPDTTNDGVASYAFVAADNGVVTLYLTDDVSDTLTVTAKDSVDASKTGTSGSVTYTTNAFVIAEDSIQVAGKPMATTVTLWSQDSGKNCAPATGYAGSQTLKVWLTRSGDDPGGTAPTIGTLSLPNTVPASDNLTLSFTNGVASFNLNTTDVGAYSLNLQDTTTFSGSSVTVSGSSNTLLVRPFALVVDCVKQGGTASTAASCPADGTANPGANTAAGTIYAKAGTAFQARVSAYLWSSAADANNDGLPDSGASVANVSGGGIATKFAHSVTLSAGTPYAPTTPSDAPAGTGTAGILGNGTVAVSAGSTTVATLTYSEVGAFTLGATPAVNYLGSLSLTNRTLLFTPGTTACTTACVVGRFIPDHFALTPAEPTHACGTGVNAFTYFGQDFATPFTLTAQRYCTTCSAADTTKNYDDTLGWSRFTTTTWSNYAFTADNSVTLTAGTAAPTGTWADGVASITAAHNPTRPAAPVGPVSVTASAKPTDADGVTLASATAVNSTAAPLRYGMLKIGNASGSERQNLPVPVTAMYYAGSTIGWAVNTLDGCTATLALTAFGANTTTAACYGTCTGVAAGSTGSVLLRRPAGNTGNQLAIAAAPTPAGAVTTLASGRGFVTLRAPSTGAPGALDLILLAPAWLRANSGQGGTVGNYDWNPLGRITFGVTATGNKTKFIYIRENY